MSENKKSRQRLPHCRELKLTRAYYIKLLDRYHIVVNRLSAVYDRDLSVGEGLLKRCGRSLGIVLSYILAIVNGDDLGIEIVKSLGHFAEHGRHLGKAADELAVKQRKILACVDGVAVEVRAA